MKPRRIPRSAVAILAGAAASLLMGAGASMAKAPGTEADCVVGSTAYPTIQSAVNNPACHTISVPAGTFRENVVINGSAVVHTSITIRGAGADYTIVDGSSANAPVFSIGGQRAAPCGEPEVVVTLERMTITGGTGPWCPESDPRCAQRNGGGVAGAPGVKLTVNNCVVTRNWAYMNGGGISVANGRLTVIDSVISRNTAYGNPQPGIDPSSSYTSGGGGLRIAGCPAVLIVQESEVKDNVSLRQGGGILINAASTVVVSLPNPLPPPPYLNATVAVPKATVVLAGTTVKNNTAADAWGGGGVYYNYVDLTAIDSTVKNNYPDDFRQVPNP